MQLTVLDSALAVASSWNNQKWLQSGANYREKAMALALWHGFPDMVRMAEKFLLRQGAYFVAQDAETLRERQRLWEQIGIPHEQVTPDDLSIHSSLGAPNCVAGLSAPDTVIDFPAFLAFMRTQLRHTRVLMGATVKKLLRDGDRITGVLYEKDGQEIYLTCDYCIVALGAWSVELLQDIGVTLPIQRWKSHIVEVEGELVERITVWADGPGVTLVPYMGHTFIANTRRVAVDDPSAACATVIEEVEILLKEQLVEAFPQLRWDALRVLNARG